MPVPDHYIAPEDATLRDIADAEKEAPAHTCMDNWHAPCPACERLEWIKKAKAARLQKSA